MPVPQEWWPDAVDYCEHCGQNTPQELRDGEYVCDYCGKSTGSSDLKQ